MQALLKPGPSTSAWPKVGLIGKIVRRMGVPLAIALAMTTTACQNPLPPDWLRVSLPLVRPVQSVERVQTQASPGSTVYVKGVVGEQVPLVNGQVYQLTDDTGSIWVVASDRAVTTGDTVTIRGTVAYEATPEFGANAGEMYLWEVGTLD